MNTPQMWNDDDASSAFGIGLSQEEIQETLAKAELKVPVKTVSVFTKGPIIVLTLAALLCFAAAAIIHLCNAYIAREFDVNFFYVALFVSSVVVPFVAMRFILQKAVIVFLR